MRTQIITPTQLDRALSFLKNGEPVAFPTETVYGLGAPVFNADAVRRIFEIKGRPSDNPLITHVSSIDQALLVADEIPSSFLRLAKWFWPGPLALVVKKRVSVPAIVSAGQPTVAIRMPNHPIALSLIDCVGEPLAAPSANLSGRPSPTSALDVLEDLDGKIALIVDGGECQIGIESTVLSLVQPRPVLLRPGSIRKEELEEALGQKIDLPAPNATPSMKYRHYVPKAKVRLIFDGKALQGPCVLSPNPLPGMRTLSPRTFFSELRRADRLGVKEILVDCTPDIREDAALMHRLLQASGQMM